MEYRILGPVEVVADGRALALGPAKQRAVLAVLLLHLNEVVSRDRLVEELWGERPPETAATALHGYVSQLRKILETGNGSERRVLVTRAPGYVLELDPQEVDLKRFELLARRGKRELAGGAAEDAARTLAEALSLWRGPPLEEFSSSVPFAPGESFRLQELLVSTLEDRIEADLALGRHDDLVAELETLVAEHPFREPLSGQLMLALYRCGRQAAALDVYRKTRLRLVEELGIEPGPALQELQQAILRHEEAVPLAMHPPAARTAEAPAPPVAEPAPEPTDGQPAAPEQAVARARRRAPRWRLLAVGCFIALAVAAGLAFAVGHRGEPSVQLTPSSVGFIDARSGRVTRQFPVGREPRALAVAFGYVWVADLQAETVTRMNRTTGRGPAIHVGGHPTGIAAYGGSIWVWTLEGLLVRIDRRYDVPSESIQLASPGGSLAAPGRIAAGGSFLWITVPYLWVLQVDPAHPSLAKRIEPDSGVGGPIAVRGAEAWIAGYGPVVFPIKARSARVSGAPIDVGGPVRDLAIGADALWVLGDAAVEQPRPKLRPVDLDDRVPRDKIAVGSDPVAVVAATGSIWVASGADKTISQIDPSTGQVVQTIKVGASPTALAADRGGDGLWVTVE
jgi:DNA-binding SARP family transcriptional activator/streptogramin lyase